MPSTSAISAYEQPSSSRMTIAARWFGGSCESARRMSSADGAGDVFRELAVADALVERDLVRPALGLAEPLPADVVRDRHQPALRLLRPCPVPVRAIGVQEGRLGDVLRVGRRAEHRRRVAIHIPDVAFVETLERLVVVGLRRKAGALVLSAMAREV